MKTISFGVMVCSLWFVSGCRALDDGPGGPDSRGADPQRASRALVAVCGNGVLDPGEQCDDGNTANHDGCSAACTLELVTQFSFTGAVGSEPTFAADTVNPGLAMTPVMSRGAGVTPSASADAFSASAWTTGAIVDPGDFYSFTVAPAAGTAMKLLALRLDERRSATGIRSWSVRSSLDGFASDLALFTVPDDTLFRTETVSLLAPFRDLATPVEFRIFGFQAESSQGTWRIDNVALIGETVPACGNGIVDPGEQCDDGNAVNGDGCEANCTLPVCGNGIVDAGEQCDDGNAVNGDGCEANCTLPACGNGIVDAGEQCDDGNAANGDGCEANCTLPACGNGVVDAGEQCDDANLVGGDGCSPVCHLEVCGNGVVDAGEQCDDGNAVNGDGCDNNCAITPILYIKASNTGSNDTFGGHIALSADGSTMAIAADAEDSAATGINGNQADNSTRNAGAVYVFTRVGATWQQQAYIKASNTGMDDSFGWSIALSADGSTLAVGAFGEDSSATGINGNQASEFDVDAGAVYVFTRSGTTWSQQAYVKASNTGAGDEFGFSVALSANGATMAVGAPFEDSSSKGVNGNQTNDLAPNSGAVYVFTRSGTTWSQQAYVKASNTEASDDFGSDVALSGDGATLVVGADRESSAATGVDGNQADNSAPGSGAAYAFTRSGTTWSQQAYLKASNPGSGDQFGSHLVLSSDGSTLAVGAFGEASAATGINGNQADNSASGAGAAYVFTRSGAAWSQQAYIKASNTGASDRFGSSLALSSDGSLLAVGAALESSAATGTNGNQASNAASGAGAVYRFTRSGATWSQVAYVKASNTETNDDFGFSVALTGDGSTLAVGAFGEDSSASGVGGNQADNSASQAGAVYVYQ